MFAPTRPGVPLGPFAGISFTQRLCAALHGKEMGKRPAKEINKLVENLKESGVRESTIGTVTMTDLKEMSFIGVCERLLVLEACQQVAAEYEKERLINPVQSPVVTSKRNSKEGKKCGKREYEYKCGYCSICKTSTSHGADGETRIRCDCGGKHRDGKSRMHANWKRIGDAAGPANAGVDVKPPDESQGTMHTGVSDTANAGVDDQPPAKRHHTMRISNVAGTDHTGNIEPEDGSNGTNKSNTVEKRTNEVIMNEVTRAEEDIDCSELDKVPWTPFCEMLKAYTPSN